MKEHSAECQATLAIREIPHADPTLRVIEMLRRTMLMVSSPAQQCVLPPLPVVYYFTGVMRGTHSVSRGMCRIADGAKGHPRLGNQVCVAAGHVQTRVEQCHGAASSVQRCEPPVPGVHLLCWQPRGSHSGTNVVCQLAPPDGAVASRCATVCWMACWGWLDSPFCVSVSGCGSSGSCSCDRRWCWTLT